MGIALVIIGIAVLAFAGKIVYQVNQAAKDIAKLKE